MDGKISVTPEKPGIKSFEDFEVLSGANGLSRDEYKSATFHNGSSMKPDASFMKKAGLLGSDDTTLFGESTKGRTVTEDKEEAVEEDQSK